MTSCEDFFSRLRKLAVTVDKESNELKGILENSEISSYNENRACVLLRETLAEVKNCKPNNGRKIYNIQPGPEEQYSFKKKRVYRWRAYRILQQHEREVNAKVEGVQQNALFGDFISACGRLMSQTREHMNELETHLEKYGYTRPKEKLPDLTESTKAAGNIHGEQKNVAMETSETSDPISSSEQSDSGDGDVPFENGSDVEQDTPMETNQSEQTDNKESPEDLLKSPVPPATFTKMIEVTPQRPLAPKQGTLQDKGQLTPCLTPEVPQTTTPMIKSRLAAEAAETPASNLSTPQDNNLPSQPVTVTPMTRHGERVDAPMSDSPGPGSPDLPAPPIMGTPGLRACVPAGVDSPKPELPLCFDSLPSPPNITSVQILRPDDIVVPPVQTSDRHIQHMFVQPLNEQEYSILPVYVANQFSLKCINQHLNTINTFLLGYSEDHLEPAILEQDLRNLLGLGAATKAFMLALVKTGRLKLAGKSIIFLDST